MTFRVLAEVVIGVLYAMGTFHQGLFVLRSSHAFYAAMADQAWIRPSELFVRNVLVPNSLVVTILVVVFQGALAAAILSRGSLLGPALIAGGVFSVVGALTGNLAETVGYGVLAALHFWLAAAH